MSKNITHIKQNVAIFDHFDNTNIIEHVFCLFFCYEVNSLKYCY